jgi:iron complex transport system ATP-binding protein
MEGVDVWYADGPRVLRDISLTVWPGQHWALLGPNGAGKSTLLALAGAARHPSRGRVEVLGATLGRVDMRGLRERIGTVDPALRMPAELTVLDYVLTGVTQTVLVRREHLNPGNRDRAGSLVGTVGLSALADRPIGVCSQGERARARLARALAADPALLVLDEPAAGLDLPGRADLLDALADLATEQERLTTVTVVHHFEELPPPTTHIALLTGGLLVAAGAVHSVLSDRALLARCFGRPVHAFAADGQWHACTDPTRRHGAEP